MTLLGTRGAADCSEDTQKGGRARGPHLLMRSGSLPRILRCASGERSLRSQLCVVDHLTFPDWKPEAGFPAAKLLEITFPCWIWLLRMFWGNKSLGVQSLVSWEGEVWGGREIQSSILQQIELKPN